MLTGCLVNLQFSSVAQSSPTVCDPMDCSTPSLPVHHQPPEFTQTHVHWVGDAIQPSHPLSSPSPSAFNLSIKKKCTTWELWVKFYWGQNEDGSPGGSISYSSERLLQSGSGESQHIRFWWRGSSIPLSPHFTKGFLLVRKSWCHHEGSRYEEMQGLRP